MERAMPTNGQQKVMLGIWIALIAVTAFGLGQTHTGEIYGNPNPQGMTAEILTLSIAAFGAVRTILRLGRDS
jgi:hypothetical protein